MGASLANSTRVGIAFKQTRATHLSATESSSSLVLLTSRLPRARRPNRPQRARSPHHKRDEKAPNAQERDQVGTWIEQSTQRRSSDRFKKHEVPNFATRCRHPMSKLRNWGGCSRTDTLSLYINALCIYLYYSRRGSADVYRAIIILFHAV